MTETVTEEKPRKGFLPLEKYIALYEILKEKKEDYVARRLSRSQIAKEVSKYIGFEVSKENVRVIDTKFSLGLATKGVGRQKGYDKNPHRNRVRILAREIDNLYRQLEVPHTKEFIETFIGDKRNFVE